MCLCTLLSSFSTSMDSYVYIRFFIGMFCGGLTTVGTILVVESLASETSSLDVYGAEFQKVRNFFYKSIGSQKAVRALIYVNSFRRDKLKFSEDEIEGAVDRALAMTGEAERCGKKKYTFVHLYATKTLAIRTLVLSFGIAHVNSSGFRDNWMHISSVPSGNSRALSDRYQKPRQFSHKRVRTAWEFSATALFERSSPWEKISNQRQESFREKPDGVAGFPYLVMAAIGFLDIVFFQFTLPETKGNPLPSEMPAKKKKATIESMKLINRA
ncbi:hypothetical protein OSTOST_12058 [Ostertagia ostertagi]